MIALNSVQIKKAWQMFVIEYGAECRPISFGLVSLVGFHSQELWSL